MIRICSDECQSAREPTEFQLDRFSRSEEIENLLKKLLRVDIDPK